MFWRVAGFSQPSPIEAILDRDNFALEELLDEDDLIQEVKSLNSRLLDYLQQRHVVESLLRYLLEAPNESDDPTFEFKYPYAVCEIITCEVEGILQTLVENEELMTTFFSFLSTEAPLNTIHTGYFSRIVGSLLARRTSELVSYLQHHEAVLERLIYHLYNASISEVIIQLIGNNDQSSIYYGGHHLQWLSETVLLENLIDALTPQAPADVQQNATAVLITIARTQPSPLASKLANTDSVELLLNRALGPGGCNMIISVVSVCLALLDPRNAGQWASDCGTHATSNPDCRSQGEQSVHLPAVYGIVNKVQELAAQLQPQDIYTTAILDTTFGRLSPPLGIRCWKIVELLALLAHTHSDAVDDALIGGGVLNVCMDLFISYPFNNTLHNAVVSLIRACLCGSTRMTRHLLVECRLSTWLANAPPAVAAFNGISQHRAGYMGHVTVLGNALVAIGNYNQEVHDMLSQSEEWSLFVKTTLRERNELENLTKWSCGRPASPESPVIESDPDDLQNEIDSDLSAGVAALSCEVFHRYSEDSEIDEDECNFNVPISGFQSLSKDRGHLRKSEDMQSSDFCVGKLRPDTSQFTGLMPLESDDGIVLQISDDEDGQPLDDLEYMPIQDGGCVHDNLQNVEVVCVTQDIQPEYNSFQFWKPPYFICVPEEV